VAFIYARFGVTVSESTPYVPVRACAQPPYSQLQCFLNNLYFYNNQSVYVWAGQLWDGKTLLEFPAGGDLEKKQ